MPASPLAANGLLRSLPAAAMADLAPHLKVIPLPQGTVLYEVGDTIERVYFPHSGVVSLVVELTSGDMIECAMVGRDSLVGGSSGLNADVSVCKAIIQIAGTGSVLDSDRLRKLADARAPVRGLLVRHEQLVLAQSQQSAACNATHTVEARLSRWLLRCRDVQGSDDLPLTQEFLAQMLGVRRTSVSLVANTLQQGGLIRYRRGHIRILDVKGLRKTACECYQSVKLLSDRLLGSPPDS